MQLSSHHQSQPERAAAFVEHYRALGFSPSETAFMAEQRSIFDRGSLRAIKAGPHLLMDVMAKASAEMATLLKEVDTPEKLTSYRKDWLTNWARGCFKEPQPEDKVLILLRFIYKDSMEVKVVRWIDTSRPAHESQDWDAALTFVSQKMTRCVLSDKDAPIAPVPIKEAMRQIGLHSLTWNRFLYPSVEDEAILGGMLVAFNKGLQLQTGQGGPLLGLGGMLRLHLDDDSLLDHGGVFSNDIKTHQITGSKNAFGSTHIRLPAYLGLRTLAHEWMHAFDCAMGDVHAHQMSSNRGDFAASEALNLMNRGASHFENEQSLSLAAALKYVRLYLSDTIPAAESIFKRFDDQMSQGTPDGGWATWFKDNTGDDNYQEIAARSLATAGGFMTGEYTGNISSNWLTVAPNAYFEKPEEQLAYGFERACTYTGILPSTATDTIWWIRNCSGTEQKAAHTAMQHFFSHPEVQQKWSSLQSPTAESPLLDAVAARRMQSRQRRNMSGPQKVKMS